MTTQLVSDFNKSNEYITTPDQIRTQLEWTNRNQAGITESSHPVQMIHRKLQGLISKGALRNNKSKGGIPDEYIQKLIGNLFITAGDKKWLKCANNKDASVFFAVHAPLFFAANMSTFTRGEIGRKSTQQTEIQAAAPAPSKKRKGT